MSVYLNPCHLGPRAETLTPSETPPVAETEPTPVETEARDVFRMIGSGERVDARRFLLSREEFVAKLIRRAEERIR